MSLYPGHKKTKYDCRMQIEKLGLYIKNYM